MKPSHFFIVLSLIISSNSYAQIELDIVYPMEGQMIKSVESTFIYGSVKPATIHFSINDKKVKVHANGAFIEYLPVDEGEFPFVCVAIADDDTMICVRNVYITPTLKTSPIFPLQIDDRYIFPREDWSVIPGDQFKVAIKGSPKCNASFSIHGLINHLPMIEISTRQNYTWGERRFGQYIETRDTLVEGIYIGTFVVQPWHYGTDREIDFKLENSLNETIEYKAAGSLSIDNSNIPQIIKLNKELNLAYPQQGRGTQLFLAEGCYLQTTGRSGKQLRIRLSENEHIWLADEQVEPLFHHHQIPESPITFIETRGMARTSRVLVHLRQRLPLSIQQLTSPAGLLLTIYGVTSIKDWIKLDYTDDLIKEISSEQKTEEICQIKIELNVEQQWGFDPFYENNMLIIDIKKPPLISYFPDTPLNDIVICLDPGHNPDQGAIGPTRLIEKDINYDFCLTIKRELESKGAFVFLTRDKEDGIALTTRTKMAAFVGADIFISMHFNSLPDGADPFKTRGVSTYYYHPQSYKLAYYIQQRLLKKTKLPNFGLFYNSLTVCRATEMISVLVEPAFIINPEEELLIQSMVYRQKVAEAITEAVEEFLRNHH